jgi:N6-adenosine-specific RNA methylase IME4
MNSKFQILVADCPWSFNDALRHSSVKRGASSNYDTMSLDDIKALPVKDIADPDGSVLALWVPSSILDDGLEVMKAWQFQLKQSWIWIKVKKQSFKKLSKQKEIDWDNIDWNDFLSFGMGKISRGCHEVALIGTRGKVNDKIKNKSERSVFFAPNLKHSQKPGILQDKLDRILPDPNLNRIELFARRQRPGYICLGNEIDGLDIRDALTKLM